MIYRANKRQVSYGEAIGIVLIENFAPFIPGDVANATTYSFPVRFQRVNNLSVERMFAKDGTAFDSVLEAAQELVKEGVRAVTADCGFMVLFQKEIADHLEVPVFLSSLLQVPFVSRMLGDGEKVGIITANSQSLDDSLLQKAGIDSSTPVQIKGLEGKEKFAKAIIEETGVLDYEGIEEEVVSVAKAMIQEAPEVGAILLECSCLPPYGAAVQNATNLPVFDFITMINYVYSAVVKQRFHGFM